jgi:hypothetical protein
MQLFPDRMSWFKMPFRAEIVTNPYNIEWDKVFIKNLLLSRAFHKNNNVHGGERAKTGWLGARIMCPSGATCLPADCCFSKLALLKSNSACWSRTKRTLWSSHWNLTCSRHDIAEKLQSYLIQKCEQTTMEKNKWKFNINFHSPRPLPHPQFHYAS